MKVFLILLIIGIATVILDHGMIGVLAIGVGIGSLFVPALFERRQRK